MDRSHQYIVKTVVVGSFAVGKTELIRTIIRTIKGVASTDALEPTCAASISSITIPVSGGIPVQLWDVPGQERFRFSIPGYCTNAHNVILVINPSDNSDSIGEIKEFLDIIQKGCPQASITVICNVDPENPNKIKKDAYQTINTALQEAVNTQGLRILPANNSELTPIYYTQLDVRRMTP